jgi:CBS domain-containing protein
MPRCPSCRAEYIAGEDVCRNCGHDLQMPESKNPAIEVSFMHDRLASLGHRQLTMIKATDPVGLAVRLMKNDSTGCALVMRGEELVGIITAWDILQKVAGPTEDLNAVTCGEIMTADPVVFRDEDTIAVAINKMALGGFRHIPLVKNGRPSAIISLADIFRHISPHLA